jgi:hypothetical protein
MPRSKHRRKPGGKAVAHPGRGKSRELPLSPEDVLWRRFVDGYTRPFHEKYGDSAAGGAGDMLDLIEEGASSRPDTTGAFSRCISQGHEIRLRTGIDGRPER